MLVRDGDARVQARASPPLHRSGVAAAAWRGCLGPSLMTRLLHDRRHLGVRDEALPALLVPVEEHPDAVAFVRVAEHLRALRAVLAALVGALGREDLHEAVELFDLGRCQNHPNPPASSDCTSMRFVAAATHRANALCPLNEVVLEGPDGRRGAASNAGLLVDVLDVMADGLGRDAEVVADLLVRAAA